MVANSSEAWRYFDPHFLLPVLDFLEDHNIGSRDEIAKARIKAVSSTFMVDHLQSLCEEAKVPVPEGLEAKKAEVMAEYECKQKPLAPLLSMIEENGVDVIKSMTLADLCFKHDLPADILDTLFEYARLSYQVGDYSKSTELLQIYRTLTSWSETSSIPTERQLRAMWGSAASFIVQTDYDRSIEMLIKLIEFFDNSTLPKDKFSYGASLLWLLHWSLFAAFKAEKFPTQIIPLLLRDKFLNIISISAPYLWKYVAAMIILSDDETLQNRSFVEMHSTNDPICSFLSKLYQSVDIEAAEKIIPTFKYDDDFFLVTHSDELRTKAEALVKAIKLRVYM